MQRPSGPPRQEIVSGGSVRWIGTHATESMLDIKVHLRWGEAESPVFVFGENERSSGAVSFLGDDGHRIVSASIVRNPSCLAGGP